MTDDLDGSGVEADLFLGFTQGALLDPLAAVELAAREGDLTLMGPQASGQ